MAQVLTFEGQGVSQLKKTLGNTSLTQLDKFLIGESYHNYVKMYHECPNQGCDGCLLNIFQHNPFLSLCETSTGLCSVEHSLSTPTWITSKECLLIEWYKVCSCYALDYRKHPSGTQSQQAISTCKELHALKLLFFSLIISLEQSPSGEQFDFLIEHPCG